jgi:hypothetical protein
MKRLLIESILNNYIFIFFIFLTGCKAISTIETPFIVRPVNSETALFTAPLAIDYESSIIYDNKIFNIKGVIKTNSNNDIYINGYSSSYGIELFRFFLKNDSVYFIDKINKKYFEGSEPQFKALNIPYIHQFELINILFGYSIFDTNNYILDSSYYINDLSIRTYKGKNSFMSSKGIIAFNSNYLIESQHFIDRNTNILIEYKEYLHSKNLFSNVSIEGKLYNFNIDIVIQYRNVKKGNNDFFNFSIPKNYSLYQ